MASPLCKLLQILAVTVLLPISGAAQSYTNVTVGASLLADATNASWFSPSREFAFGFRPAAAGGGYLLGIWFDQIPEKTIIWSANRNNPAPKGSRIHLTRDGRLELNDPRGQGIWASDSAVSEASYAAMLDTGNLVIASAASSILWQSFDHPTDTFVPSQRLNRSGELVSSFSQTNHSEGRFLLTLQSDGDLSLCTRNFPMGNCIKAYFKTNTVDSGFSFVFNESGYLNLIAQNGTVLTTLLDSSRPSTSEYFQRLTLEYDGVLRHYLYPKFGNLSGGRAAEWSVQAFLPGNICTAIAQDTGGGACGFNSFCSIRTDQRPQCGCPNGYSLLHPDDSMGGCKPDFVRQSCDQGSNETGLFGLYEMPNTNCPFNDYAHFMPVTEDWCRRDCLADCLCDAVVYNSGSGCWKKRVPLSSGMVDPSISGKTLIKIRRSSTAVENPSSYKRARTKSGLIVAGSVLLGSSAFVNILLLSSILLLVFHFNRRKSILTTVDANKSVYHGISVRCYSFKELQEATNGFGEEIGNGAFATVYKGTLQHENGKVVAVKKLKRIAGEADEQFKAEVSSISRTNHKHLVQLLGYCDEGQHRILVYEFMSNGSSADFLFNNSSKPSLYTRIQIAFAVARGLCYLHEDCTTQIIHCDIKHQNVLLDDTHTAKISDFGLAKLLRPDQTRTTTGIRGTRGYLAPEWFRNMPITAKVDVYSYGVMLLELLCFRKNFDPDTEDSRMQILADWAYDCFSTARLDLLVSYDPEMADDMRRIEKLVKVALWCVQEDPEMRPRMKRVIQMLEGSVEVPPPPNPASLV